MDIRKLQRAIVNGLEDVKGHDIAVFNTEHLSPLFERVIIASGASNRQTRALAASVRDAVKSGGFGPTRVEGDGNGEWVIVDCGAAVVHVMQPSIRAYYDLESIWGGKPVRLKLRAKQTGATDAVETKPASKRPLGKVSAPKQAETDSTSRKKSPAPKAKKSPAKKVTKPSRRKA